MFKKIGIVILSVLFIAIIASLLTQDFSSSENPTKENEVADGTAPKEELNVNSTVEPTIPVEEVFFKDGNFVIVNEPTIESDTFASYFIGTVRNDSGKKVGYAQISISLYDEDGAIVGTAYDNISNIDEDGLWKFKAMALEDFASWKIIEITGF